MSIIYNTASDGGGSFFGAGSNALATITGVNTGDTILIYIATNANANPVTSVQDGQGTYSNPVAFGPTANGQGVVVYALQSAVSGTHTVTITMATGQTVYWAYAVYSGASLTTFDGNSGIVNGVANITTVNMPLTLANAGDTVVSAVWLTSAAPTSQTGTIRVNDFGGALWLLMDQVVAGSGAATPSVTYSASNPYYGVAIGLIPATTIVPLDAGRLPLPGPGVSPSSRFQFSSLIRDTSKLTIAAIGSASIVENSDIAAGTGTLAVTGSAAITEGPDAVAGVGVINVPGTAAITESPDIAAGTGSLSVSGSAAVAENPDVAAGIGAIVVPPGYSVLQGPGPGVSPSTRFQFSMFQADTTKLAPVSVIGTAAIIESADMVSGIGSLTVSGSAAINETPDTVAATGTLSVTGSAAITEGLDTVTGVGNAGGVGSAAIVESPDVAAGAGTLSVSGSAAITEQPDTVVGTGTVSVTGSAAVSETPDVAAGTGTAGGVGTAAVHESPDIASGSGTVGYAGTAAITEAPDAVSGVGFTGGAAAITEGPDTVVGTGSVGVVGSANVIETPDVVAGAGVQGVRFGCSTISVEACACVIIEESACFIIVNFIDESGQPFIPDAAQYRLDDVASARQILDWTPLTAPLASTMRITVTAAQNILLGRPFETHQCLVQLTDGYGDTDNIRVTWEICQVVGLPN